MLVKSLVFNFLMERERLFLVFPFFAVCLQSVCSLFARLFAPKIKKNEGKSENKCMYICIQ